MDSIYDFIESVADNYGYLLTADATKILSAHGITYAEAHQEIGDSLSHAGSLLEFLGY